MDISVSNNIVPRKGSTFNEQRKPLPHSLGVEWGRIIKVRDFRKSPRICISRTRRYWDEGCSENQDPQKLTINTQKPRT